MNTPGSHRPDDPNDPPVSRPGWRGLDALRLEAEWQAQERALEQERRGLPLDLWDCIADPDQLGHPQPGHFDRAARLRHPSVAVGSDEDRRGLEKIRAVLAVAQIRVHGTHPCESETEHDRDNAHCGEKSGHFRVRFGAKPNAPVTRGSIVRLA